MPNFNALICPVRIVLVSGLFSSATFAASSPQNAPDYLERANKIYMTCSGCHTNDDSGKNAMGPNLKGVVGRPIGKAPGFAYSTAMKSTKGNWTAERLDAFLTSPSTAIPGTNMPFAGLSKPEDRKAIIQYLAAKK